MKALACSRNYLHIIGETQRSDSVLRIPLVLVRRRDHNDALHLRITAWKSSICASKYMAEALQNLGIFNKILRASLYARRVNFVHRSHVLKLWQDVLNNVSFIYFVQLANLRANMLQWKNWALRSLSISSLSYKSSMSQRFRYLNLCTMLKATPQRVMAKEE